MFNYAVINISDNIVINKVVADSNYIAPNNTFLIQCDDISCDIGWSWDGVTFINPNPFVEETDGN